MSREVQQQDRQHKQNACDIKDFSSQWTYTIRLLLCREIPSLFGASIRSQSPRLVDAQYRDSEKQHDGECGFLHKLCL